MRKNLFVVFILMGALSTACNAGGDEPPSVTDLPTSIPATREIPDPVIIVEATNTYIPIIEVDPTATTTLALTPEPTGEPTVIPTPTLNSPATSVDFVPVITQGLEKVTFLTHAFDERLFVLEQVGRIRIIENNQLLATPFLDIRDRVGSVATEQGLLGLAFHPDYSTPGAAGEGLFFVNYTDYNGDTHISRFSAVEGEPNLADPNSEVNYLTVDQPYHNHNGGSLVFGPDGYLYAGLGDGGSQNDPLGAGQDLSILLGKILRLDVDSVEDAYAVPADNPFAGSTDARPEIWAYGLRNPWRISFDRATGDLFIADVGQNQWEEVNFQPAGSKGGENYGWSIMEATHCLSANNCDQSGLVMPIFEYDHSQGCSITGGYIYRGQLYPELTGNYFASDYCSGIIWRLFHDGSRWVIDPLLDSDLIISTFGEDVNGELYVANYWNGGIFRLTPGR